MNTSLRFGWDADLVLMDYLFGFQWIIEALVLLFLHSTILLILMNQKTVMLEDIRRGYLIDQIGMIFFGWTVCYIVKMYPIYPWPGFYCDGLICRIFPNIQQWIVMLLSAFAIISVVPCFQYLTFRVYSNVVSVSDARFYVGQRAQFILLVVSTAILGANVVAFGVLAEEPDYVREIYDTPEITQLLRKRGGRVVIFGSPGDPGIFIYEIYLIFISVILILPVICIMMLYARRVIKKREHMVSSRTHKIEDRLAKVFFIQIISVIIFYCIPLVLLLGLMIIDTSTWPAWLLAIIRPMIMLLLTLKSTVQSMIFILKNPTYAKRVFQQAFDTLRGSAKKEPELSSVRTRPSYVSSRA